MNAYFEQSKRASTPENVNATTILSQRHVGALLVESVWGAAGHPAVDQDQVSQREARAVHNLEVAREVLRIECGSSGTDRSDADRNVRTADQNGLPSHCIRCTRLE